jgi:DNA-binding beta-propeller fold protein YncE
VLVYDVQGNCVGSFGQPSDTPADNTQFDTIGGIAVDADGNVYVADSAAGRLLKFAPFVDTIMPLVQQDQPGDGIVIPQQNEATEEVTAEVPAG